MSADEWRLRLARKQHTCILCGMPIPVGEFYVYTTLAPWHHPDNTGFTTYRAHHLCDDRFHSDADTVDGYYELSDPGDFRANCLPVLRRDDVRLIVAHELYQQLRLLRPRWPVVQTLSPDDSPYVVAYWGRKLMGKGVPIMTRVTAIVDWSFIMVTTYQSCQLLLRYYELAAPDAIDAALQQLNAC